MERVLYNLHHKLCTMALEKTTTRGRRLAERLLLFVFVAGFGVTMLVHVSFVHRDTTTLDGRPLQSIPLTCLSSIPGFSADVDVTHVSLLVAKSEADSLFGVGGSRHSNATRTSQAFRLPPSAAVSAETGACAAEDDASSLTENDIFFSYSRVQGYLFLSPERCAQHNISVQHVMVSKTDERCFGEPFLQNLVFFLAGPDTVMINWLLGAFNATGFVYNPRTKNLFDLAGYTQLQKTSKSSDDNKWIHLHWYHPLVSKAAVVLKTSFLFFILTTLVSFILRETQERMLAFTHQLQARVRSRRPVVHLVMTHVVENLVFVPIMVGMIFFLIEFYRGDKVAAFMVLSIVWVCEAFSVVRYVLHVFQLMDCRGLVESHKHA